MGGPHRGRGRRSAVSRHGLPADDGQGVVTGVGAVRDGDERGGPPERAQRLRK